jgi:hypothetical protein
MLTTYAKIFEFDWNGKHSGTSEYMSITPLVLEGSKMKEEELDLDGFARDLEKASEDYISPLMKKFYSIVQ